MEDIFRLATIEDAPAYLQLLQSAYLPLKEMGIDWASTRADLQMVEENILHSSAFVLERRGEIISTITVRFPWESEKPVSNYPFVWWFATKPELKGKGIGDKLLTYVEDRVLKETLKAPAVTLGTSAKKHPWLLDMYKRRGYEVYYEMNNDDDIGVMMRKVLIPERFNPSLLGIPVWT